MGRAKMNAAGVMGGLRLGEKDTDGDGIEMTGWKRPPSYDGKSVGEDVSEEKPNIHEIATTRAEQINKIKEDADKERDKDGNPLTPQAKNAWIAIRIAQIGTVTAK